MVRIRPANGTANASFCIDTKETTSAEYAQFLVAVTSGPVAESPDCDSHSSHVPAAALVPDDRPVANVTWCDAFAYCSWAGKRLCGQIGAPGNVNAWNSVADDEWYSACSLGGANTFPYGLTYGPNRCNGYMNNIGHTLPVGTMPFCVGGYPGIFDMSGNVWEWEWSCAATGHPATDPCRARGGGYVSSEANLRCGSDSQALQNFNGGLTRLAAYPLVGIRCCAD
jgi:sulfatase modifying factor 1